jgi:hypothetical protein
VDNAVALVQAYLRVNGYFTVAEYPVMEAMRTGYRTLTDIDILGVRFPHASWCHRPMAGMRITPIPIPCWEHLLVKAT